MYKKNLRTLLAVLFTCIGFAAFSQLKPKIIIDDWIASIGQDDKFCKKLDSGIFYSNYSLDSKVCIPFEPCIKPATKQIYNINIIPDCKDDSKTLIPSDSIMSLGSCQNFQIERSCLSNTIKLRRNKTAINAYIEGDRIILSTACNSYWTIELKITEDGFCIEKIKSECEIKLNASIDFFHCNGKENEDYDKEGRISQNSSNEVLFNNFSIQESVTIPTTYTIANLQGQLLAHGELNEYQNINEIVNDLKLNENIYIVVVKQGNQIQRKLITRLY